MRKSLLAVLALTINFVTAQIFITEIADPNNSSSTGRFVELFNIGTSDVDLGSGWGLQRWTNENTDPQTAVNLTGTIPAGGFYIITNDGPMFETAFGFAADQDIGTGGPADSNGDDKIALLDETSTIIDMYGVVGEDVNNGTGNSNFEDGRAERISTVTGGNNSFYYTEWAIDNDQGEGAGAQDAPEGFDPNVWFNYTDPVTDPAITNAYSTSGTEIYVDYDQDLTTVAVADYTLTGTAGVTFSSATIDATDASVVHLTASADINEDATLDVLADAANSASFDFYAGITPISATNEAISTGTIDNTHTATFQGTVSANDAYNNVWISDAAGAYNGVLIFDYSFDSDVSVGDIITITATRDEYNGLTELKNPELISTASTGNTPYGPDVIAGSDIASTLTADTNPGEQWEGQLVKIDGATVVSYADAGYEYTCTDDGGATSFVVGGEVDYQLSSVSLSVGSAYDIVGVVDFNGTYRINPRDAADVVDQTPQLPSVVTFDLDGLDDCGFVSVTGSFPDDAGNTWSGWGATNDNNWTVDWNGGLDAGTYDFTILCVDTDIPDWYNDIWGNSTQYQAPAECGNDNGNGGYNYQFTVDGSGDPITVSYCAGTCEATCVVLALDGIDLPNIFALHNNYPNPFNPVTNITYDIPEVTQVTIDIYNISGQKVRTLAQGQHEPGRYRIQWNATNNYGKPLSSGMYIYRIRAGNFVSVKKLILMK